MTILLIGFGAIALAAVILPLLDRPHEAHGRGEAQAWLEEREAAALAELRDLEFDHRLGKLSEEDYRELRAQLARRGVAALKAMDERREAEAAREKEIDDLIEREVAALRAARAGMSNGRKLAAETALAEKPQTCPACSRAAGPDDRFCARCGAALPQSPLADGSTRIAEGLSPVVRVEKHEATHDTQHPKHNRRDAIRGTRPVSRWLLAAGVVALVWAVAVGGLYLRARAAIESQRPIATLAAGSRALTILPADPDLVFLGRRDGLMWSSDGGATWRPTSTTGDVLTLAVHPASPLRVYLAGRDLFLRSDDGGRTWQDVADDLPGRDIRALATVPHDSEALYAFIAGQGLWRSENGGVNWTPVDRTLSEDVMALAIAPGTIYVGTDGLGVLASSDGGATWASANGFVNGALGSPRVRALAYDPVTGTLYAGTDRGLSFATNVGSGWTRRPFDGDVAALALGPDGTTVLLVTSAGEVYRSRDRGVTWGE